MDPKLAEIYGTNQPTEADLEKLAAAELAEGLANDDQIDTDGLTEEDLEAIAQDVLGSNEDQDEEQEKTSAAEEAQEKLAEADYLGRVMAHAYVNELRTIEKTAGIADMARGAGKAIAGQAKQVGEGFKSLGTMARSPRDGAGAVKDLVGTYGVRGAAHAAAPELKALGVAGAGTLGAGMAAKKMMGKKKESAAEEQYSAVDTLVLARAQEILQESGIDPNELEKTALSTTDEGHALDAGKHESGKNPVNPFGGFMTPTKAEKEKKSADEGTDPRDVLANEVEQRAWNLLGEYGVVPSEE